MSRGVLLITLTIVLNVFSFGQIEKYTKPINWERYKLGKKQISILLPKMPVFYENFKYCSNLEIKNYFVYAEDVVYQIKTVSKSKNNIPSECPTKIKFGKEVFDARLKELTSVQSKISEREFVQHERKAVEIKSKTQTAWIFNDLDNNQWIELAVAFREDAKIDEKRFSESLEFGKNPTGEEIGEGAEAIFGDEMSGEPKNAENNSTETKTSGIIIVSKPAPRYTDAARQANVQGTISLRVTFLANGGIGSVSAVNGLPYGLTEQAIIAAKKIAFLPARKNGKNYSVTKVVQYTFSIY